MHVPSSKSSESIHVCICCTMACQHVSVR